MSPDIGDQANNRVASLAQMKPDISIVIAVKDNWRQLKECLESIAAQYCRAAIEVVVIDDGSRNPAPADIVETTGDMVVRIYRQIGLGVAAARNHGIHLSNGGTILFVDSDCLLDPHCIEKLVAATQRYLGDISFQLAISTLEKTLVERIETLRLSTVQKSRQLASGHIYYANTSGFAIRSASCDNADGFFDIRAIRGSDTVMLANLLRKGLPPRYLADCKVYHSPKMAFVRYAIKHYYIGYHSLYSRDNLRNIRGVLIDGRTRLRIMRRLCRESVKSWQAFICRASAFLCYAIEKGGYAIARVMAVRIGESKILGVRVNGIRRQELIYRVVTNAERRNGFRVSYANAWTLVQSQRDMHMRSLLNSMDVCLVDGIGVKLAAVLLNEPRVRKVTPNDIIFDLCRELSYRKLTIALVGSQAAVLESAGEIISRAAPNLGIVVRAPGFLSHAEELSLMEELSERKPDVVILGMGQPLQEQWAVRMKVLLPTSVLFCVGGLFDYLVGPRRWADVARRFGLEWAFRFCCSPRRTSRRYLYGIPALFAYIINDYVSGFRRVVGSVLYPGQKLVGERRVETFVDKP